MAGRPSNRDERYEQVMHALVRTVARFGLEGASLSSIAKEAGMTRPLVRHHLGNRDEILTALQDYVLHSFEEQTVQMVDALPHERAGYSLIEILFSPVASSDVELIMAFSALTASSADDPALRKSCREVVLKFETAVADVLKADHPKASEQQIHDAAHQITALYFNVTSLSPLEMPDTWSKTAHRIALRIIEGLEDRK